MIPPHLVFVSSSAHKHREVEVILGVSVERLALDLPEPQGLDLLLIAREKARLAYQHVRRPVLVEDTALELAALGGFPGPLVRWLLQAAGAEALPRILVGFDDDRATARCAAVIHDSGHEWVGVGAVAGRILPAPSGASGFGWDVVFAPEWGGGRSYAEMTVEEKSTRSHRALALTDLARALAVG